jgi:DNA repair protein SbcD/Mre11
VYCNAAIIPNACIWQRGRRMRKIRFIHTADIHMGSLPHITGDIPSDILEITKNATFTAFKRICDAALENEVDFIVISGDLYDREARSVKSAEFFAKQCERLYEADIHVYMIAGNHDPLNELPDIVNIPDNVHVLKGGSPETYKVKDSQGKEIARVIGQSYSKKAESLKMHESYDVSDSDVWNIALLHTQLEQQNVNYVPCSLSELTERQDIHYWALGHIHEFRLLNPSKPAVCYSGIPQGRDFGEEGAGGFALVELCPYSEVSVQYIPVSPVVWKRVNIAADEDKDNPVMNITELEDMIFNKGIELIDEFKKKFKSGYSFFEGFVVQWIIEGRSELYEIFMQQEEEVSQILVENLRKRFNQNTPFLWTDSISSRIKSPVDLEELVRRMPVIKDIDRIILSCTEEGGLKNEFLDNLGQVWDRADDYESRNEKRLKLDENAVLEILDQAKQLIMDRLSQTENKMG